MVPGLGFLQGFVVGCLVLETFVFDEPEIPLAEHFLEVDLWESLLLACQIAADVAGRAESLSQHRLSHYWDASSPEDMVAGLQGSLEGRDQDDVWFNMIGDNSGLLALLDPLLRDGAVEKIGVELDP